MQATPNWPRNYLDISQARQIPVNACVPFNHRQRRVASRLIDSQAQSVPVFENGEQAFSIRLPLVRPRRCSGRPPADSRLFRHGRPTERRSHGGKDAF
jgi:hypothetical protein